MSCTPRRIYDAVGGREGLGGEPTHGNNNIIPYIVYALHRVYRRRSSFVPKHAIRVSVTHVASSSLARIVRYEPREIVNIAHTPFVHTHSIREPRRRSGYVYECRGSRGIFSTQTRDQLVRIPLRILQCVTDIMVKPVVRRKVPSPQRSSSSAARMRITKNRLIRIGYRYFKFFY